MESKRNLLITRAFELFYTKGIHAVGINEILQYSGVAKKTLYHHFTSKDELVIATLKYRDDCFYDWLARRLNQADCGAARIEALFDALDDWFNDRVDELQPFAGCFFINVSGEYGNTTCQIHKQCKAHKSRVKMLIKTQLDTLGLHENTTKLLLDAVHLLKEGAITLAHVQGDKEAALKAKASALQLIHNSCSV